MLFLALCKQEDILLDAQDLGLSAQELAGAGGPHSDKFLRTSRRTQLPVSSVVGAAAGLRGVHRSVLLWRRVGTQHQQPDVQRAGSAQQRAPRAELTWVDTAPLLPGDCFHLSYLRLNPRHAPRITGTHVC